jgi:hypothetical protein
MPVARLFFLALILCGCEAIEPEVAVCNHLGQPVQIANISYRTCYWPVILSEGECTSPCACRPGDGRVRFRLFDIQWFVNQAIEEADDLDLEPADDHIGWKLPTPIWYAYRTATVFSVDYGDFKRIDILGGGIEQDFEAPGPNGH